MPNQSFSHSVLYQQTQEIVVNSLHGTAHSRPCAAPCASHGSARHALLGTAASKNPSSQRSRNYKLTFPFLRDTKLSSLLPYPELFPGQMTRGTPIQKIGSQAAKEMRSERDSSEGRGHVVYALP